MMAVIRGCLIGSLFLLSTFQASTSQAQSHYRENAEAALSTLQQWYNTTTGLWDTAGWWNSANILTTIADFAAFDKNAGSVGDAVFANTFRQAQQTHLHASKGRGSDGLTQRSPSRSEGFPGFINDSYDDEGWWALGWIRVYDVTRNATYLAMAKDIFEDMTGGWNDTRCGGGIWWDKRYTYVNAIANELFLSVAAHLANRPANGDSSYYLNWAQKSWAWFQQSGMINAQNTINDGLLSTCENNGDTVWSYNQGVILGGLVELSHATAGEDKAKLSSSPDIHIKKAKAIANAAISALSDSNGILHDTCEPNCHPDATQFKGIFMRNLQILYQESQDPKYKTFLESNAASIWDNDRDDSSGQLSVNWAGPFVPPANASTHSSALDALVGAAAVQ